MNRIAEIIYSGKKWTAVRFVGESCTSLVNTNDLERLIRKEPLPNSKVEINIYEIHLHGRW